MLQCSGWNKNIIVTLNSQVFYCNTQVNKFMSQPIIHTYSMEPNSQIMSQPIIHTYSMEPNFQIMSQPIIHTYSMEPNSQIYVTP